MLVCLINGFKLTFLKVLNMSNKPNKSNKLDEASKPKEVKKPKKFRCLYDLFANSRVVVVLRNGVIIEGVLLRSSDYEILLNDAVVKGSKHVAKVEKIAVSKAGINLVHSLPIELTENDNDSTEAEAENLTD